MKLVLKHVYKLIYVGFIELYEETLCIAYLKVECDRMVTRV